MSLEVESKGVVCSMCGKAYSRRKGYFPVSYSILYKGIGYIPICRECIDGMYNKYLAICGNSRDAVRQVCRKLDLYWSDSLYDFVERKSTNSSMMTNYIARTITATYATKCYDNTLLEEGTLWGWSNNNTTDSAPKQEAEQQTVRGFTEEIPITEDIVAFWGAGYTDTMYAELEQRRRYWMNKFPSGIEMDIGTEAIIRQICSLELDINRDRAAGRAVDKSVNALNTLLGSASLKPTQRKNDDVEAELSSTPLGVWLYRYENKRPLPEIDESLKDTNNLKKYIFTWMGHVCKMLGIKNGYTKMYEQEIERLRVDKPEYEEDDESLLIESYSEETEGISGD